MYLLYNGNFLPEEELNLPLSNRAFQYNDGFFETVILSKGKLRFWPEHLERIKEAGAVLKIQLPSELTEKVFEAKVTELAKRNKCGSEVRVKLKVWRAGAGLYTPLTNEAEWLLTAQPALPIIQHKITVGICQSIHTIPSPFSAFKGVNSPVYVLASQEKAERALDDLILLSPEGHVAELTYSNIFWVKEKILYTPALDTGCLNGVLRRRLLHWAKENQWQVVEGKFSLDQLQEADLIFGGNVTSLRPIKFVEGKSVALDQEMLHQLNGVMVG